ncbi:MAG: type II toxin-antitoxin system VapC family toxin [Bacteroidetes bacterium]|nr:type II toxin-antitoxin system VapC family toxin [Bacteroidota bacterium]
MRFVIDTSAVISVITNEPNRTAIVWSTRGAELLAPASLHWEVGNAFSAMMRRGRIGRADAIKAVQAYQQIPLRLLDVDLQVSLRIVEETGMYAYDAYVLACAQSNRAPLLTLDRDLKEAARKMRIPIVEVAS